MNLKKDEDNFKIYYKSNRILTTYPLDVTYALFLKVGMRQIELLSQNDNNHFNKKVILVW